MLPLIGNRIRIGIEGGRPDIGFHAHFVEGVALCEFVDAEFYFYGLFVCGDEVEPLAEAVGVRVLAHIEPILVGVDARSCRKVSALKFALKSDIHVTFHHIHGRNRRDVALRKAALLKREAGRLREIVK